MFTFPKFGGSARAGGVKISRRQRKESAAYPTRKKIGFQTKGGVTQWRKTEQHAAERGLAQVENQNQLMKKGLKALKICRKKSKTIKKKSKTATQKDGTKTFARRIYRETYDWLQKNNCADLISAQLVENFAEVMARHIQAEGQISQSGFIIRQPTTGEPIATPLIKISLDYLKSAQQLWYQISQFAKENGTYSGADEAADMMERILTFRKE